MFESAVAWLDCVVHDRVDAGDHMILIGRVVDFAHSARRPLGYCRGNYLALGLEQKAMGAVDGRARQVGAVLEADGGILFLVDPDFDQLILPVAPSLGDGGEDADNLTNLLKSLGIDAEIEFLFAVYDDAELGLNIYYRGSVAGHAKLDPARACIIPFDDIPWDALPSEAINSMLGRYITERRQDLFGVYVGDTQSGDVHRLR